MTDTSRSFKRSLSACAAVGVLFLAGCGNDTETSSDPEPASETTAAADDAATTAAPDSEPDEAAEPSGDEGGDFCAAIETYAGEEAGEQDYEPLKAAAPDEIAPLVDDLADAAEQATSTDEPSAEVEDRGARGVVAVTLYAVNECEDTAGMQASLGLDDEDLDLLTSYSLEDVQNDDKWAEMKEELDAE